MNEGIFDCKEMLSCVLIERKLTFYGSLKSIFLCEVFSWSLYLWSDHYIKGTWWLKEIILEGILLYNIYDKFYAIIMIEQDLGTIYFCYIDFSNRIEEYFLVK